jgi:hypothetical protein
MTTGICRALAGEINAYLTDQKKAFLGRSSLSQYFFANIANKGNKRKTSTFCISTLSTSASHAGWCLPVSRVPDFSQSRWNVEYLPCSIKPIECVKGR